MSVADLAIDVGIPKNSDEYDSFIGCVENILEYGCGYDDRHTASILEKCHTSQLNIAKQVIRELERPAAKYRQKKLKWWQEWQPTTSRRRPPPPNSPKHRNRDRHKRPMDLDFQKRRPRPERQRGARPRTQRRTRRARELTTDIVYERPEKRQRPMSPIFPERSGSVPEWPGRTPNRDASPEHRRRYQTTKRRRFR